MSPADEASPGLEKASQGSDPVINAEIPGKHIRTVGFEPMLIACAVIPKANVLSDGVKPQTALGSSSRERSKPTRQKQMGKSLKPRILIQLKVLPLLMGRPKRDREQSRSNTQLAISTISSLSTKTAKLGLCRGTR